MIAWLSERGGDDPAVVGGKAANLCRLYNVHPVPEGFTIGAEFASRSGAAGGTLLAELVGPAYAELCHRTRQADVPVAVRSSAVDEDGAEASFAGQHDTYLNVRGREAVVDAVARCIRSAQSPEALAYRAGQGLSTDAIGLAVLVQALIPADVAAVAFSANPLNGNSAEVLINSSWGLGESVVGGTVTPDLFVVDRASWSVARTTLSKKTRMTVLADDGTSEVAVPRALQEAPSLVPGQAIEIAQLAVRLEEVMGWPSDVECGFHGEQLYLFQCRPITTGLGRREPEC